MIPHLPDFGIKPRRKGGLAGGWTVRPIEYMNEKRQGQIVSKGIPFTMSRVLCDHDCPIPVHLTRAFSTIWPARGPCLPRLERECQVNAGSACASFDEAVSHERQDGCDCHKRAAPRRPASWPPQRHAQAFRNLKRSDAVTSVAEEVKNPAGDLPIGRIGSSVACLAQ